MEKTEERINDKTTEITQSEQQGENGNYIIIKGLSHQENTVILMCMHRTKEPQHMQSKN